MNRRFARFLLLPVFGVFLSALMGCTGKPDLDIVAQCIADKATPAEVSRYGSLLVSEGKVTPDRWASVGCKGGWAVATDKEARQSVAEKLPELLVPDPEFRAGAFSALLGDGATLEQRKAVASLGLKLEDFANLREEALNCIQAPEAVLLMMAESDLPFAIAVLGSRADIGEPAHARALAAALLTQVSQTASLKRTQQCEGAKDTEFRAYAAELESFMAGTHPWAPGCRAEMDDKGMTLSCRGVDKP
ncbi:MULTISPECIES: hypothetical protein [unclassified Variovorax]|uniref:hypothetical protein n=1 Tax=unclassified Variovorax TaxID=663243 RepID=UPI000A88F81F|nr:MULTISPECIES: hypothetical protein [unclassified Variovorax]PNG49892.1 hypothetical protein CHC06_05473 [Variovorax sp. B2]PNG50764.1 hypothetical protein CHC07_05378 [Variovorax sp. B4]VTV17978.1 hypothetical protein WDL1P1_00816 [Variovorax sp. WDL1]